ncbi:MAG TPA: flagellar biosynthesis anti-sigma factor FlgM [Pirellulales bacterium]|jgi:negative regulator of flagellin synthesis FlgM|nr:flagellar biosynthesis anti-sigma factor FlgM [Pirellulales bacterium]
MQIFGPSQVHGPQSINAPHSIRGTASTVPARSTADVSDELHISDSARIAGQLSEIPDIRQDRVNSIRTAIAQGTYETDGKMGAALDRLLDEIG